MSALPAIPQAQTIEEVIEILEEIVAWSVANESRLGYFPALYQLVTVKVKAGCDTGYFDDPDRMRKLDVVFANRYLAALEAYRQALPTTRVWEIAMQTSQQYWPLVLQHLMVGMNAHINLDLGIAAGEIAPGEQIHSLQADFNKINTVLNDQVNAVQGAISRTWPPLWLIDWLLGTKDEKLSAFSMKVARDEAWKVALTAAALNPAQVQEYIAQRDEEVTWLARKLQNPGWALNTLLYPARLLELGTKAKKTSRLAAIIPAAST